MYIISKILEIKIYICDRPTQCDNRRKKKFPLAFHITHKMKNDSKINIYYFHFQCMCVYMYNLSYSRTFRFKFKNKTIEKRRKREQQNFIYIFG